MIDDTTRESGSNMDDDKDKDENDATASDQSQ
jgi:hypothetical protein